MQKENTPTHEKEGVDRFGEWSASQVVLCPPHPPGGGGRVRQRLFGCILEILLPAPPIVSAPFANVVDGTPNLEPSSRNNRPVVSR